MDKLLSVFVYIAVAFALAFLVESTVEYVFGELFEHLPEKIKAQKWALRYLALLVGVGVAWYWQIDLIAAIARIVAYLINPLSDYVWLVSPLGVVLSGIGIGRGAVYLHDWLKNAIKKPDVVPLP